VREKSLHFREISLEVSKFQKTRNAERFFY